MVSVLSIVRYKVCVCVWVWVCGCVGVRERERERERGKPDPRFCVLKDVKLEFLVSLSCQTPEAKRGELKSPCPKCLSSILSLGNRI